jgi:hypothetical protein
MTKDQREKALIEIDEMDEEDESGTNTTLHTANEIIQLPEVKKPDITLGPDVHLEPIGSVMSIVDSVVVIQASSSGEVRVLDSGTVVAVVSPKDGEKDEQKEVLGEVRHIFLSVLDDCSEIVIFKIAYHVPLFIYFFLLDFRDFWTCCKAFIFDPLQLCFRNPSNL